MKRKLCAWALIVSMILILAVPVSSADTEAGFYNIETAPEITVEPCGAAGPVRPVSRNVDGRYGSETFYPGADRLRITVSGAQPGAQYILTISAPEKNTVYFVDQRISTRTVTFDAAFVLPEAPTALVLSIGSTADDFTAKHVPLSYTPAADSTICAGGAACPMSGFSDLDTEAWYHDGVHWALDAGVMNGAGADVFAPDLPASRAMLVTMLWRMDGQPKASGEMTFSDVAPGRWYTEAIRWAASEGLVKGYNVRTFGPDDALSREQLVVILYRFAQYHGNDVTSGVIDRLGTFLDAEKISPWALEAMRWAVHTGLLQGVGGETLRPKSGATRAQTATMLMRFCS